MPEKVRVLVVGAGIGGLSTALSLRAAGLGEGVAVVDASRRLLPLGAGINLQPHAVRELEELGVGGDLAEVSAEPRRAVFADRHGNPVVEHPRGRLAGYRWPQLSVHRGELQRVLLEALRRRPGAEVRTGLRLVDFTEREDRVVALLRDRNRPGGPLHTVEAEALVGADGVFSAVRSALHPGEGAPLWNGIRMWRGVAEAPLPLDGRTMLVAGSYRPARLVVYPLGGKAREKAGVVNWVAEARVSSPPGGREPLPPRAGEADWNAEGRLAEVLAHFADWRIEGLDIPGLLRSAPRILEYPMVDRDPLPYWGRGRATLLGDAAHPMYPVGSNGGSLAVLDARVLAWALAEHRDEGTAAGLRRYEAIRRGPAERVAAACREMPVDRTLDTVSERAPHGFARIEDVLTRDELHTLRNGARRTTDMDVEELNSRPSWGVEH